MLYGFVFIVFAAFSTRLFSVLRYESVIHEFDPYFNYRTTKFLADEGYYKFHNWYVIVLVVVEWPHQPLLSLHLYAIIYIVHVMMLTPGLTIVLGILLEEL